MGPTVISYTEATTAIPAFHLMVEGDQALPTALTTAGADADPPTNTMTLEAYDEDGFTAATPGITVVEQDAAAYPGRTSKKRRLLVTPTADTNTNVAQFVITIPEFETPDNRVKDADDMSDEVTHTITVQMAAPASSPKVVSIQRLRRGSQTVVAAFQEAAVAERTFDVRIVLTEAHPGFESDDAKDNDKLRKDMILVEGGEPRDLIKGVPFVRFAPGATADTPAPGATVIPNPIEGMYEHAGTGALEGVPPGVIGSGNVPLPSGTDMMYRQYRVTIMPYARSTQVKISLREFNDGESPRPYVYAPVGVANKPNGREQLRLDVVQSTDPRAPGFELPLPDPNDAKIPANGFYLLVRNKVGSGIDYSDESDAPDRTKVENVAAKQTPAQLLYNVRQSTALPNLETFLVNHGTIELVAYGDRQDVNTTLKMGDIYISEVMWGSDAGLLTAEASQWIELATSGAARDIGDSRLSLHFYQANETPPVQYVREQNGALGTVIDRIGTKTSDTGRGWSIAGKGQSGRTAVLGGEDVAAISPRIELISMYRGMVPDTTVGAAAGAMVPAEGTMPGDWMQATRPAVNFRLPIEGTRQGHHIGTPGSTPDDAAVTAFVPPTSETVVPVAAADDIKITEIMVDTGNDRFPQWIELNNVSGAAVSLAGWSVMIENDPADADVIGGDIEIQLSGTLGVSAHEGNMGQGNSLLLVSRAARSSSNLDGNKNIVDVSGAVGARGHYKLISDVAFMITLAPPQKTGVFTPGDMAGNLDAAEAWDIPMDENGRSSLIRREMDAGMMTMGTDANGWVLASSTSLVDGPATWYGSDEDAGTPGYDAGGPLPVELSHFRPARDKATGAVVITWATQSELNNAGFFIKRSSQRDGEFKVINATMIAGAGTTSEKQTYTFTDTTAQPNIVYYYQIEDVSLDGNRQTLTRGIRLKGHIGAAGKLTSTWGELKSSNE